VTYLVDANVLSEAIKPAPSAKAMDWLRRHEPDVAVDPIILGEVRFGILKIPVGKNRRRLERWFAHGVVTLRCLPWDRTTGLRWAELVADMRTIGRAMPIKDSMIAATALVHGLTVSTRNVRDFRLAGVRVVNPFD
jgi:predicted nucleic acid-binding protein